jgi:hypothetical protein
MCLDELLQTWTHQADTTRSPWSVNPSTSVRQSNPTKCRDNLPGRLPFYQQGVRCRPCFCSTTKGRTGCTEPGGRRAHAPRCQASAGTWGASRGEPEVSWGHVKAPARPAGSAHLGCLVTVTATLRFWIRLFESPVWLNSSTVRRGSRKWVLFCEVFRSISIGKRSIKTQKDQWKKMWALEP